MLIAVDTNVLIDLADGNEDVIDALSLIRKRVKTAQIIASPTVLIELVFLSANAEEAGLRKLAQTALGSLRKWNIKAVNLVPVGHGIVEAIALKVRGGGLMPDEEEHDAMILAEAALLGCKIIMTGDAHLRGIDFQRLKFLLDRFDVSAPIIATPREIVSKFFG